MSPAADTSLCCFHCGAMPGLKEMADGWCDSCGKRLPDACAAEAKRHRETAKVAAPAARGRFASPVLWAAVVLAVAAMAAVALAM